MKGGRESQYMQRKLISILRRVEVGKRRVEDILSGKVSLKVGLTGSEGGVLIVQDKGRFARKSRVLERKERLKMGVNSVRGSGLDSIS